MKRRINKIVSLLIVLCMIVTILPVEAEASNADLQKKMINVLYAGAGGRMTCDFDGYVTTSGRHEGIDFARTAGASIYSLISGVVTRVTNASKLSTLAIYDSTNNKTVVYLHGNYSVSVGQTITQGQYIGTESNNGASAAHTHIEVRDGKRTAAAISVGDSTLDNANPYPYWSIIFGNPNPIHTQDSRYNGFVPFKSYPISTGNIAYHDRYCSSDCDSVHTIWSCTWSCCFTGIIFCISDPMYSAVHDAGNKLEKSVCPLLWRTALGGRKNELERIMDDTFWNL